MAGATAADQDAAALTARFGALALALSGYPLRIARAGAGELSYTDGETVFIRGSDEADPYVEIAVQCLLLSGGSLSRGAMLALLGQGRRTRRFLRLEAMRLLAPPGTLAALVVGDRLSLPPALAMDARESLRLSADRRLPMAADPLLGMIRPSRVLARSGPFARGAARPEDIRRADPRNDREIDELDDIEEADELPGILKRLSSPLNIPNPFSRFLHQAMGNRRAAGVDEPGMEVPTTSVRQSRSPSPAGRRASWVVDARLPDDDVILADRWTYPEWDCLKQAYRPQWCAVREVPFSRITDRGDQAPFRRDAHLESGLRRLALGMARVHRQTDGDDLDVDAVVDFAVRRQVDLRRHVSAESRPAIYSAVRRVRHDLGAMLLLDISGSVAERDRGGDTVLREQVRAASALLHGLTAVGSRTAALAFHSQGRGSGRMIALKSFEDQHADAAVARMSSLRPSGYTRLGAGIRHAAHRLAEGAGTERRLLVVVSDGVPYDLDYSGRYGVEDVIRALEEAAARLERVLWLGFGSMAAELEHYLAQSAHHHVGAPGYAALRMALPHHVATAVLGTHRPAAVRAA